MAGTPWFATREQVQRALDVAETARADSQIDQALAAGAAAVRGLTHRDFYPVVDTRYFDWPNYSFARSWRLWLDENEMISVTAVTSGDSGVLDPGDVIPWPADGPPYKALEIDLASSAAWSSGPSYQQAIAVTGVFGYRNDETPAGATAEALDASETGVDVTDGSLIGVGDLVRCDDERMIVTGRGWLDSTQNLGAPGMTIQPNNVAVPVTDGSAFHAGEQLTIDSERMLIVDVVGNSLVVKRAYRGSVLAAHSAGADIYVDRALTVERGALGTTAASHLTAAAVVRWVPPAQARSLNLAEALVTFEQEKAAYARTVGSGENERNASGSSLKAFREQVYWDLGRTARKTAI